MEIMVTMVIEVAIEAITVETSQTILITLKCLLYKQPVHMHQKWLSNLMMNPSPLTIPGLWTLVPASI